MLSTQFSASEQAFCLGTNIRLDGRSKEAVRPLHLSTGVLVQSHGSSRFPCGFCSVKATIVHPSETRPSQGFFSIQVDSSNLQRSFCDSLQSPLQDLISVPPSSNIDNELVIQSGKYVWELQIDVWLLKADTLDNISVAIRAAIHDTGLPRLHASDLSLDHNAPEVSLSSLLIPVIITIVCLTDSTLLVDATALERSQAKAQLHVALVEGGQVCGIRWESSHSTLPTSLMTECIGLAIKTFDKRMNSVQISNASSLQLDRDIVLR